MPPALESLPAQVIEAWRNGHKIEAIRLLREGTRLGLAEARAVIEGLDAAAKQGRPAPPTPPPAAPTFKRGLKLDKKLTLGPRAAVDPTLGPGEVPRTAGEGGAAILILVAALVLVYFLLR